MNKLIDIFNSLNYSSIKWNTYFDVYEKHFSKFVGKSPKILEIGILGGGSIEMWLRYFGEGTTVVGLDINKLNYQYNGNAILEAGDQGSAAFWDEFLTRHSNFDVVIDDGGHTMDQQIMTLNKVFPHLNDGGIFLVEDTHTSYWSGWGGGLNVKNSFQNKAKQLTDVMNKEHVQDDHIPKDILDNYKDLYSISFYNSIVVFEKRKVEPFLDVASKNGPKPRTVDSVFFINSSLYCDPKLNLSVFSNEQRFQQTLETIESIDRYCPDNIKFIFDSSPELPNLEYVTQLEKMNVVFYYTGNLPGVKEELKERNRSTAETIACLDFINWYKKQAIYAKRIYKISGRYKLNDNFVLNDDRYKDAFVFKTPVDDVWLEPSFTKSVNAEKLYRLRLWHMDANLLDTFEKELKNVLDDCLKYKEHNLDIEHAYYKNLHKYKTIEVENIGVSGYVAPTGEYIDE